MVYGQGGRCSETFPIQRMLQFLARLIEELRQTERSVLVYVFYASTGDTSLGLESQVPSYPSCLVMKEIQLRIFMFLRICTSRYSESRQQFGSKYVRKKFS